MVGVKLKYGLLGLVLLLLSSGCMTTNITVNLEGDGNTVTVPQTKTVTTEPDVTVPLI